VTGALCPERMYFSGARGIHSAGLLFSLVGAPAMNSFSASANLASSSITYDATETFDKHIKTTTTNDTTLQSDGEL